jgi:hypothetical protein
MFAFATLLLSFACILTQSPIIAASVLPVPITCGPASWQTIVAFYLLNYATHVMTLKSLPGEKWYRRACDIFLALLVPFSGVQRACSSIACGMLYDEDDLQHAARGGALCAIVRTRNWRPLPNEIVNGCRATSVLRTREGVAVAKLVVDEINQPERIPLFDDFGKDLRTRISPTTKDIHGEIMLPLPPGYALRILPVDIRVTSRIRQTFPPGRHRSRLNVSKSHSVIKYVASIVQLSFGCVTLFRTRGDQLDLYGYAAFGLTVLPYVIMSLLNFVANVVTPDYLSLYMVWSEVMEEAINRGGRFDGTVGMIDTTGEVEADEHELKFLQMDWSQEQRTIAFVDPGRLHSAPSMPMPMVRVPDVGRHHRIPPSKSLLYQKYLSFCLALFALITPYAVIAGMTQFEPRHSTSTQRGFTMAWLVVGQVYGYALANFHLILNRFHRASPHLDAKEFRQIRFYLGLYALAFILVGVPTVGGFVVVSQMLKEVGSCSLN